MTYRLKGEPFVEGLVSMLARELSDDRRLLRDRTELEGLDRESCALLLRRASRGRTGP